MADLVPVGRVGRPHGLDGSFVVEDASDDPERFAVGARLLAGEDRLHVVASKRAGGRMVVRLDRAVERGTVLAVPRDELPPAEEGGYYVFELVGVEVEEEGGRRLGSCRTWPPGWRTTSSSSTRATRCRSSRSASSRSTSNAAASWWRVGSPSPTNFPSCRSTSSHRSRMPLPG